MISENSNPSLRIFQVSIQDNDGGDTHAYTMISDPGDGMSYFDIDAASTYDVSTHFTSNATGTTSGAGTAYPSGATGC